MSAKRTYKPARKDPKHQNLVLDFRPEDAELVRLTLFRELCAAMDMDAGSWPPDFAEAADWAEAQPFRYDDNGDWSLHVFPPYFLRGHAAVEAWFGYKSVTLVKILHRRDGWQVETVRQFAMPDGERKLGHVMRKFLQHLPQPRLRLLDLARTHHRM